MSVMCGPTFKNLEGELRKNQEFMGSDIHNHHHQKQQQQHNSGLMRFHSAPGSFFGSLLASSDGGSGDSVGGGGCEDFRYLRSSSPEMETILEKFMSSAGSGDSKFHDMQEFRERSAKHEVEESVLPPQNMYRAQEVHDLQIGNSVYGVMNSTMLDNSIQAKMGSGNCSNLMRQSSSPAGFFSNLNAENGFTITRDMGNFRACNGTNGEASPPTGRFNGHLNFSSRPSSCSGLMPQISENGNEEMEATSPESGSFGNSNGGKRCYMPSFTNDSWDDSGFNGLKRARNDGGNMFSGLSALDSENGEPGKHPPALIHHLSLPKTSAEIAAVEKFLHFQGPFPIKIRAKRGCATHPRSIAERVRRTRISERMRKLQELFPNMDKQTNTADMLDLAVDYIKNLQKQVKTLTDTRAKCSCTNKQKQCSNPSG